MQKISRLQFWSAFLGNLFEHYDTALFGMLSPFLAPLFFPDHDPMTALVLTYCIIPLGMIIKPIGALFFGYIGDCWGRKEALFFSLFGMAVASGLIACIPTYQQVGVFAPILLSIGRMLQSFFATGESVGGAIYLLENSENKKHNILSSVFNMSTMGGVLLASSAVSLLSYFHLVESSWRWLYAVGCITGLFGCVFRVKQSDSHPIANNEPPRPSFSDLLKSCWKQRQEIFFIAVATGFSFACYSVAFVLINGFVPLVSSITKAQMMHLNTLLLVFDFATLPFFGWLANRYSREKMMLAATSTAALTAIPLFGLLEGATLYSIIGVRIALLLIGASFSATFQAWCQDLVPKANRYTVISMGHALGAQILGGSTAAISLWMFRATGMVSSVAWYWIALGTLSGLCILVIERKRKKNELFAQT